MDAIQEQRLAHANIALGLAYWALPMIQWDLLSLNSQTIFFFSVIMIKQLSCFVPAWPVVVRVQTLISGVSLKLSVRYLLSKAAQSFESFTSLESKLMRGV